MLWIISVVSLIMLNDIAVNAPTSKTPEKEHVLVLKMLDFNIEVLFILHDMHTIILFSSSRCLPSVAHSTSLYYPAGQDPICQHKDFL